MSPSIQVVNFQQQKQGMDKNCAEKHKPGINLNNKKGKTWSRTN